MMRHPFLIIIALSSLALDSYAQNASGEQLVDRVVAVVNNEPILHSEVQRKINIGQPVLISAYPAEESGDRFEQAMQDEINFELVMQKVEELAIDINDGELETEIDALLKRRNSSKAQLLEFLAQDGTSYESYKAEFRKQLLLSKFQGRVINPLVKVTDRDLEAFYLKKVGSTSDNVNLTMRQLLVRMPQDAAKAVIEAKRERAREAYNKLQAGMDFKEAAKLYSDLPNAKEDGGLVSGSTRLSELNKTVREKVAPLKKGQFTEPVETPAGFFIFFLEDRSFAGGGDFKRERQKLEYELRARELETQTKKWLAEQRRRSKVKIIN